MVMLGMSACAESSETADDTPAASQTTPAGPTPDATSPCLGTSDTATPPNSGPETEGYLGLTEQEAKAYAKEQGQTIRVAGRDDECYALTMDYRDNRVNIYLVDDVVVAATIG